MTSTPPPPFPDPTINEMIADRVALHCTIDELLKEFHQHNAGLRLRPALRRSFGELRVDIAAHFSDTSGTCDMGDARLAIAELSDNIRNALAFFVKKYAQAVLVLTFNYINGEAQATLTLQF